MIININPRRLPKGGKTADRRSENTDAPPQEIPVPRRAHVNVVPSPDSLDTFIRSAVAALRKGIRWDRGTILNLLT